MLNGALTLSRTVVMRALLALGGVVVTIAIVNLSPLMRRPKLQQLLDMNIEATAVVWFSSALLLMIAASAAIAGLGAPVRAELIGWSVIASLFALLSLDETASLHELAGNIADDRLFRISWLPNQFLWVVVVAPFAAAWGLWMLVWLRRTLGPGSTPLRMAAVALVFAFMVPVCEALVALHGSIRLLVVTEESLELSSEILMLGAIALHLVDRGFTVGLWRGPAEAVSSSGLEEDS